jgi:ABC-type lipoprotein export system ATPase subunit
VAAGEVVAVMGPSGSGKSTLLNLIAGLDRPTSGTGHGGGRRIDTWRERAGPVPARHVGIIFQFFNLLDDLTVEDNVLLPAQLAGASRRQARARAGELLARMGLESHRNAYPARLSGGQRQRVAIARALVNPRAAAGRRADRGAGHRHRPGDRRAAAELNEGGQTLVLVTHDPGLAARYAARTVRLVDGRLAGAGVGALAMSWYGPVRTATGGLLRHKVQAVVIGMVLLVSTASATLGLALLAAGNAPFTHAFAAQHGADVTVTVNPARATATQLAATVTCGGSPRRPDRSPRRRCRCSTRASPGVSSPAGRAGVGRRPGGRCGAELRALAGRARPGGAGRGVRQDFGGLAGRGNQLTITGLPGATSLTVVGIANSVTDTADGWVVPGEIAAPAGGLARRRARSCCTGSPARAPAHSSAPTWRRSQRRAAGGHGDSALVLADRGSCRTRARSARSWVPFVVAFALIGLVMSVLIVANVVSGAVVAGYRRIGVLKSIGFSPGQVVAAYVIQVDGARVRAGCVIGVVAGNLLAVPLLGQTAQVYGVGTPGRPGVGRRGRTAGHARPGRRAAVLLALRAGRMSAVQAIATGRAPRAEARVRRAPGAGPGPGPGCRRPVTIGLAGPFARPTRTADHPGRHLVRRRGGHRSRAGLGASLNLV